jgi:hypothetical protein
VRLVAGVLLVVSTATVSVPCGVGEQPADPGRGAGGDGLPGVGVVAGGGDSGAGGGEFLTGQVEGGGAV